MEKKDGGKKIYSQTSWSQVAKLGHMRATSAATSANSTFSSSFAGTAGRGASTSSGAAGGRTWGSSGAAGRGAWGSSGAVGGGAWGTSGAAGRGAWGSSGAVGGGGWGSSGAAGGRAWGSSGAAGGGAWGSSGTAGRKAWGSSETNQCSSRSVAPAWPSRTPYRSVPSKKPNERSFRPKPIDPIPNYYKKPSPVPEVRQVTAFPSVWSPSTACKVTKKINK